MKQYITEEQWNEIETEKKLKVLGCSVDLYNYMTEINLWELITIGKMVEIINNVAHLEFDIKKNFDTISECFINWSVEISGYETVDSGFEVTKKSIELCDSLWEVIKEVL